MSSEVTRKRLQSPGEGAGSEKSQISLFRFARQSALLNSRETSGGSAAAHYAELGVKARRGRGGGGERRYNGAAAILFAPPLRARSVFRDARFPLPSTAPGPLHCPTAQRRGGGCFLCWTPEQRPVSVWELGRGGWRGRRRPAVGAALPASGGELTFLCGRRGTSVGPAAAMLCLRRARRSRRGCARGVRAPGPAGFLPLAEGDCGGARS